MCSLSCRLVLPGHLVPSAAGPTPCFVFHGWPHGPSSPSRPSLAAQYEGEAFFFFFSILSRICRRNFPRIKKTTKTKPNKNTNQKHKSLPLFVASRPARHSSGRFRGPSGRAPFSDEGGFTFSEAPFEGTLHEGLKGASPSEAFKEASPSEGGA